MSKIIIGTRGSDLALWQANHTQELLSSIGIESEITIIKTQGDKIQHLSFDKMEGKGFFTKEIEEALLSGAVDLAVHSHKDLETRQPEGLCIAAVPNRSFVEDVLLIRKEKAVQNAKFKVAEDAVIGTSSARRKSQLKFHLPQCTTNDLRGNVPTRIDKLRQGQYDAIVLAKAGIKRLELDLSEFEVVDLEPTEFIPAPAQGALAFQMRDNDPRLDQLKQLTNTSDAANVRIERTLLRELDGGCQLPFGAHCTKEGDQYHLFCAIAESAEAPSRYASLQGTDPVSLVEDMLMMLKKKA
ncbi:hydroxymethylbilane synthase [Sanyastnella coralliicola]|uniref:hydroxymethylbilane synthase n=1 Tax=Sanyastnella coralliicola TaxID=3069118 RepID=UPI0027BAF895|nr:hydroxymethylbilane synthase [Longitalea sp. SCSIO 12813]